MKKQGSMRGQIEHWRKRALVAEQANGNVAGYVEEERQKANAVALASQRVVYMAGADAAGLRLRLEDIGRQIGSWLWRLRSVFRSVKPDLELVEAALSGKVGTEIADQRERLEKHRHALSVFADEVRASLDLVELEQREASEEDDLESYRLAEETFRFNVRHALEAAAKKIGVELDPGAVDEEADEELEASKDTKAELEVVH